MNRKEKSSLLIGSNSCDVVEANAKDLTLVYAFCVSVSCGAVTLLLKGVKGVAHSGSIALLAAFFV